MTTTFEPELHPGELVEPQTRPRDPLCLVRRAPGSVLLGLAGSVLVTVAGARLSGGTVRWWFHPRIPPGGSTNEVILYLGMAALAIAWLGIGRAVRSHTPAPSAVAAVGFLWCAPLLLSAPLFSRDVYSYIAQGTIAHLGLSPYHDAPAVLGRLGQSHVLGAVDPFWRRVTAPYGPLFLSAVSVIVSITGTNLVLGALLVRAIEILGLVLLAVYLPRLARVGGADPARAVWLVLLSPLVLLQLVAAAHNDLLMIGLIVAGVTLALEGRPLLGVAVCALATTIKVPAIAAVIFILVTWARNDPSWPGRLRIVARGALVAAAVLAAVTLISGLGIGWVSTGLFSTPGKVRLAVTPATALAWTIASVLHGGVAANFKGIESVLRPVGFAISVLLALRLLERSRLQTVPRYLGLALIAFAFGGPAAWPWYFAWGLVLLAAASPTQASWLVAAALVAGAFLVKPDGILLLSRGSAPFVLGFYVVIGAVAWYTSRHRGRAGDRSRGSARSALAEP